MGVGARFPRSTFWREGQVPGQRQLFPAQSSQPLPLCQDLDHHWEAADTFKRPAFESWLYPNLTVLLKAIHTSVSPVISLHSYQQKTAEVMHCHSGLHFLERGEEHLKVRWEIEGLGEISVQGKGVGTYWRIRRCVFIFPVC